MDSNDQSFFENLVGAKSDADETYEVELAKASNVAVVSRARAQAKREIEAEEESETDALSIADEGGPEGSLIVDVYETSDDIVVQSAIAGVRPEDIDISATPDTITIRGAREHRREVSDENYLCQECYWGRFAREIMFPQEVDPESAQVTFKNGILTVRLPKAKRQKSKKLSVKAD